MYYIDSKTSILKSQNFISMDEKAIFLVSSPQLSQSPGYQMQYVITAYVKQFLCQVLKSICIHCYDMIFFCLQNRQIFGRLKYKYIFLDPTNYRHEFIFFGEKIVFTFRYFMCYVCPCVTGGTRHFIWYYCKLFHCARQQEPLCISNLFCLVLGTVNIRSQQH